MNTIWSKLRKRIESFLVPELLKRVSFHQTGYHNAHDGVGEAFITLDKNKIIEGSFYKSMNNGGGDFRGEDLELHIDNLELIEFLCNGYGDVGYITLAIERYLNFAFDDTLIQTNNPIYKILVLLDRRLGKRKFQEISLDYNDHDGVKKIYAIRKKMFGIKSQMKIMHNNTFQNFLDEFRISNVFEIDINLPKKAKEIIERKVRFNDKTIYFEDLGNVTYGIYGDDCYDEKSHNHFHVDWYVQPMETEKCFQSGVRTLLLFAENLINLGITGVGLYYSFHSADLSKQHEESLGFDTSDGEYCIGDELSMYKLREGSIILDNFETKYWAILSIKI